jgi:acyl carrier protein
MRTTHDDVLEHISRLLLELGRDWDYQGAITGETLLFRELGFASLDIVVLGTAVQEHYGCQMPFAELFTDIGNRGTRDLTVAELGAFVYRFVNAEQTPHSPVVAGRSE